VGLGFSGTDLALGPQQLKRDIDGCGRKWKKKWERKGDRIRIDGGDN
jgi:hypothetical protein